MKLYRVNTIIEMQSEKAYGVTIGGNGSVSNPQAYTTWIPKSQCKREGNIIYISAWIINQHLYLQSNTDYNDYIEIESPKRKPQKRLTKEEKAEKEYQEALNNWFEDVPEKFYFMCSDSMGYDFFIKEKNILRYKEEYKDLDYKFFKVENGVKEEI